MVLPYINMNPPQVYTCSPSWTLLPPPSPYIPLGRPSAPAPSIQYWLGFLFYHSYGAKIMTTTQLCLELKAIHWQDMNLVLVAKSCLTLCDPMDCSPLGSSVHGILQARILAIPFSRGSFWLRDWTWVSCIVGRPFTVWAPREAISQKGKDTYYILTHVYGL